MSVFTCTRTCTCTCVRVCVHARVRARVYMHVCVLICVFISLPLSRDISPSVLLLPLCTHSMRFARPARLAHRGHGDRTEIRRLHHRSEWPVPCRAELRRRRRWVCISFGANHGCDVLAFRVYVCRPCMARIAETWRCSTCVDSPKRAPMCTAFRLLEFVSAYPRMGRLRRPLFELG